MIDQAIIERAGQALDELFAAVEREHPGVELLVRSNPGGFVFRHRGRGDDLVVQGSRVFVNLMRPDAYVKAYADSTAEAVQSVLVRAIGGDGLA